PDEGIDVPAGGRGVDEDGAEEISARRAIAARAKAARGGAREEPLGGAVARAAGAESDEVHHRRGEELERRGAGEPLDEALGEAEEVIHDALVARATEVAEQDPGAQR